MTTHKRRILAAITREEKKRARPMIRKIDNCRNATQEPPRAAGMCSADAHKESSCSKLEDK